MAASTYDICEYYTAIPLGNNEGKDRDEIRVSKKVHSHWKMCEASNPRWVRRRKPPPWKRAQPWDNKLVDRVTQCQNAEGQLYLHVQLDTSLL